MRKKSKYKPRAILANPLGYVLESMTPVAKHDSFMIDLKIKNHGAMTSVMQGKGTRQDVDALIQMLNVTEALYRLGFGTEYKDVVNAGLIALRELAARGAPTNKFILRASEIKALNEAMELHDAQMEVITIRDMEKAIKIVYEEIRNKKAIPIKGVHYE
jgi:hypothetical protein